MKDVKKPYLNKPYLNKPGKKATVSQLVNHNLVMAYPLEATKERDNFERFQTLSKRTLATHIKVIWFDTLMEATSF